MSWIQMLYETYENSQDKIGSIEKRENGSNVYPLLPVFHSTQNANLEVTLDENGQFKSVLVLTEPGDKLTIIPVTEESAGRTSKPVPHPLFDKMQYVAGDYLAYGGAEKKFCYDEYMKQLDDWQSSAHGMDYLKIIYAYLQKGSLLHDLAQAKVFLLDEAGKIKKKPKKDEEGEIPELYDSIDDPLEAFVRFRVLFDKSDVDWRNRDLQNSYIGWYKEHLEKQREKELCYVTGKMNVCTYNAPSKLRHTGDKAKLYSANDASGFTYRGRFFDRKDTKNKPSGAAVNVSMEVIQKSHSALRWLISKQGYKNGEQVYLVWGSRPMETGESLNFFARGYGAKSYASASSTYGQIADNVNKALAGYRAELKFSDKISVIGLNAATQGRLSINYYKEFLAQKFLDRLSHWYSSCVWQTRKKIDEKWQWYLFTPIPKEIALAVYGENVDDKAINSLIQRILPCILEEKQIPRDIVMMLFRRFCQNHDEKSNIQNIACAVIRKWYNDKFSQNKLQSEEVLKLGLDENNLDRSYLFGRLLAYADQIESTVLYQKNGSGADASRETNAERYKWQFSLKPAKTWQIIDRQLGYYLSACNNFSLANKWKKEINAIIDAISVTGFTNERLEPQFILGYASQKNYFVEQIALAKEKKNSVDMGGKNNE